MKTIFDKATRAELIRRIEALDGARTAEWGKMNVYQMLRHCTIWEAWIQGKPRCAYRQEFMGRIFGRVALKSMIKDDKPLAKNVPTSNQFKVSETHGDIAAEKKKWIDLIEGYDHYANPDFIHDFFGRMTPEQIGLLAYKHTDHHLRQFGA